MEAKTLKRLLKEKKDNETPSSHFYIQPLKNNNYEWHFTILGVEGTPFEGGVYHGKFILPKSYPVRPPDIFFMTENGRFMINRKICLNITSYHAESWTPAWSLRTMTQAICAYFLVNEHGIGALFDSEAKRKDFAKKSRGFKCKECGCTDDIEKIILDARDPAIFKKDEEKSVTKSVERKKTIKKKPKAAKAAKPIKRGRRVKAK